MAKSCHARRRRPQLSSSSSSTTSSSSSSSSVSDDADSSCSSCTSSASGCPIPAEQTQHVSSLSSQQCHNFHSETVVHKLHQRGLLRNKVLVQAPHFDPTDGAIIYATKSKVVYTHSGAKKQLSDHLAKAQHYCGKQQQCSPCRDVCCTRRAKLMLDFVQSIPNPKRGNRAKCKLIVDRILSR